MTPTLQNTGLLRPSKPYPWGNRRADLNSSLQQNLPPRSDPKCRGHRVQRGRTPISFLCGVCRGRHAAPNQPGSCEPVGCDISEKRFAASVGRDNKVHFIPSPVVNPCSSLAQSQMRRRQAFPQNGRIFYFLRFGACCRLRADDGQFGVIWEDNGGRKQLTAIGESKLTTSTGDTINHVTQTDCRFTT
jgi:hypothetical protein